MSGNDPAAEQKPVPSHGGAMSAHLGLILHITTNDFDPYGFFSDPNHQASSNWWIAGLGSNRPDGHLEQYVDADLRAWAQAAGNSTYDSVETSGKDGTPMTAAQIETLAQLYAWGHGHYGWPFQLAEAPGQRGLGWHGMGGDAWGGHFNCPGDARKAQRQQVLDRAQQIVSGNPHPPQPPHPGPDRFLHETQPLMTGSDVADVIHALRVAGNTDIPEGNVYTHQVGQRVNLFNHNHGIKDPADPTKDAAGTVPETWTELREIVHGGGPT